MTTKEAIEEAKNNGTDLRGANLREADLIRADLYGANLHGVELCNAKFYGRGGKQKLKKSQLPDFVAALGFIIEE